MFKINIYIKIDYLFKDTLQYSFFTKQIPRVGSYLLTNFGMVYLKWADVCQCLSLLDDIKGYFSNAEMSR